MDAHRVVLMEFTCTWSAHGVYLHGISVCTGCVCMCIWYVYAWNVCTRGTHVQSMLCWMYYVCVVYVGTQGMCLFTWDIYMHRIVVHGVYVDGECLQEV